MNDIVSCYRGIDPKPAGTRPWPGILEAIRDGKFKADIERARKVLPDDPEGYRELKKNLFAATFGGAFNGRRNTQSILSATGIIVADLDHLQGVEDTFKLLVQDDNILFVFRSPSGEGLKCGVRAEGILNDEDHKRLYAAVSRYFLDVYGLEIDRACKDICRLTFVSHDPALWINPAPRMFDIDSWLDISPIDSPTPTYQALPTDQARGKLLYTLKVLDSCCEAIRASSPGTQHATRLAKARLVGGYMHYGMDEGEVIAALEAAVRDSGAKNLTAAMKTVRDGLAHGRGTPIHLDDTSNKSNGSNGSNEMVQKGTEPTFGNAKVTRYQTPYVSPERRFQGNLTASIREYLLESTGSFTAQDIDREFGLTHPLDRNLRRKILHTFSNAPKDKIIKKDLRVSSKYCILKQQVDWINLEAVSGEYFQLDMPLGLSQMVNLPPKSICVIAGTSNAGKTAFLLHLIQHNLHQAYDRLYLMSEMGPSEYLGRVSSLSTDISLWNSNVRAAAVTSGFDGVISQNNPDGLTVVDFLEEIEGEYFKIPSDIRSIYDALRNGIAWVALQKHSQARVGRGGEGTTEKARLYITIDTLAHQPRSTISAIKIIKAKDYNGENPNGKELHVRIISGSVIEPVEEFRGWQYITDKQRQAWVTRYEHMAARGHEAPPDGELEVVAKFACKDGQYRYVNRKNADKWQANMPNIDVYKELQELSEYSTRHPLNNTQYFMQLAGMLGTTNEKVNNA